MTVTLTTARTGFLETLVNCTRVLPQNTFDLWWRSRASQKRNVRALESAGLIRQFWVTIPTLRVTGDSIATWSPGEPYLDCVELSSKVIARFRKATEHPRTVQVAAAMDLAHQCLGDGRRKKLPAANSQGHDVAMGELYATLRRRSPELASQFIGEDVFAKSRSRLTVPDAMLEKGGKTLMWLEFCGAYSANRLLRLVQAADRQSTPIAFF